MSEARRRITKRWDPEETKFKYQLEEWFDSNSSLDSGYVGVCKGDLTWAKKNAKHYNIVIPEEETQDDEDMYQG